MKEEFVKKEFKKIEKQEIFVKTINGKEYVIKSVKDSDYKEGNINAHIRQIRLLRKNLKGNIPKTSLSKKEINREKYLIISCEKIEGKLINLTKRDLDKKLKTGMLKLLKKGYVLDFYGSKNFIRDKNRRIYYIDSRMPLFSKKSNEGNRFEISKKVTKELLK